MKVFAGSVTLSSSFWLVSGLRTAEPKVQQRCASSREMKGESAPAVSSFKPERRTSDEEGINHV